MKQECNNKCNNIGKKLIWRCILKAKLEYMLSLSEMSRIRYTIRNYRPADFDNLLRLMNKAEKADPVGRPTSAQLLSEYLKCPNYSPEKDLFLIETESDVIGFAELTPELTIGRTVLDLFIHPEHGQKELAQEILSYTTKRAKELGVREIHACISETNTASRKLLSEFGFRLIRRFNRLKLNLVDISKPEIVGGISVHHLESGEENQLVEIQNRAFSGHWGYNPNTLEEISYFIRMSDCSHEGIFLACQEAKPVGYCWTKIDFSPEDKESRGQIFMLGVDPSHQGRQIGKVLLQTGLGYLKSQGIKTAVLMVDSENKKALSLYRSAGFKAFKSYLWYGKTVA